MKSFQVDWTVEQYFRVTVQAATEDDAELKFFAGEYAGEVETIGEEAVEVVEITDTD